MAVTNVGIKWRQRRSGSANDITAKSPQSESILAGYLKDNRDENDVIGDPPTDEKNNNTGDRDSSGCCVVGGRNGSINSHRTNVIIPPNGAGDPRVNIYKLARRRILNRPANRGPLVLIGYNVSNQSFEDISCLGESTTLSEVSLDGNPFAQVPHYKQTVLRYMQHLRQMDMKRISDDERRIASVMARKEEDKKRETNKIAVMKEKRKQAINNARRQWEVMQGSLMSRTNKIVRNSMPEIYANHVANLPNSDLLLGSTEDPRDDIGSSRSRSVSTSSQQSHAASRPTSAKSTISEKEWPGHTSHPVSGAHSRSSSLSRGTTPDKERHGLNGPMNSNTSLNVDFLHELDGDTLSLYGGGSLDAFDKTWGIQSASAVTTICFKFIDFDDISKVLHKIRVKFPNVHTLIFNSTNIHNLSQLNALASLRRLDHLVVDPDGNSIVNYSLWRTFVLFRLAHFCLKRINDVEVSATDIVNAEKFFGTLAHMTTTQLPQARLLALLGEKKKQYLTDEKAKKQPGENKLIDRATESVGRAGLVYNPFDVCQIKTQEQHGRWKFVRSYVKELARDAILTDQKQGLLLQLWPQIFGEMVRTSLLDMWDSQAYMKKCMEELEKS